MGLPISRQASAEEIPVIDLTGMRNPATIHDVASRVADASKSTGFFYIANHGTPQSSIAGMFDAARHFFALPLESKMEIALMRSRSYRGYLPMKLMGKDTSLKGNIHEGFQIHRELPPDDPDVIRMKPLHDVNQWPSAFPELRAQMLAYYDALTAFSFDMLKVFAIGLDLPEETFHQFFRNPMMQLRFLHYPPQEPSDDSESLGTRPHTDSGAFTLLAQDDIGGLEILKKDGEWITAPPVPGTYVVNLGEMMKVWTDGIYAATPHRVINRYGQERYSVPFFATPDYDAVIAPILSNPSPDLAPKFATSVERGKPITSGEILTQVYTRIWPGAGLQSNAA